MTIWATPTLAGRHVSLSPLDAAHADGLRAAAADGALWTLRYTSVPGPAEGDAEAYIADALAQRDAGVALPFVVRDADGDIVGSTRFYDIDRSIPRVSIGYTWYAVRTQRTGLNTEAKLLLVDHAFASWNCEAVVFETSHENIRSQTAILRLGAKRDGVLRAHRRHRDGTLRDTHVFSILRHEWPALADVLRRKLESHPNV
ncbi:GNAT family N-acetyltransferase [Lysobacter brunescens]|uniref:GNAT family N-acetyltransferase n=1 Tax=Lysobacter brunescens TaxID=262323 RepID=A0ABW2YL65_9GAMM